VGQETLRTRPHDIASGDHQISLADQLPTNREFLTGEVGREVTKQGDAPYHLPLPLSSRDLVGATHRGQSERPQV